MLPFYFSNHHKSSSCLFCTCISCRNVSSVTTINTSCQYRNWTWTLWYWRYGTRAGVNSFFFNSIPIPIPLRSIPIPIPLGWKIAIPIMVVPASGHQVRCIPWVQMGTFNKEIDILCGLNFFTLNIFCGEYLQSSLHLMLQIWWKPLLWKMCQ